MSGGIVERVCAMSSFVPRLPQRATNSGPPSKAFGSWRRFAPWHVAQVCSNAARPAAACSAVNENAGAQCRPSAATVASEAKRWIELIVRSSPQYLRARARIGRSAATLNTERPHTTAETGRRSARPACIETSIGRRRSIANRTMRGGTTSTLFPLRRFIGPSDSWLVATSERPSGCNANIRTSRLCGSADWISRGSPVAGSTDNTAIEFSMPSAMTSSPRKTSLPRPRFATYRVLPLVGCMRIAAAACPGCDRVPGAKRFVTNKGSAESRSSSMPNVCSSFCDSMTT